MRTPPPEAVTLAVLVGVIVFAGVLLTAQPPHSPRGEMPPAALFPPNIDSLPTTEEELTRRVLDRPEDAAAWHKLGLVLEGEGQAEQARSAQMTARDRIMEALAAAGPRPTVSPWAFHLLGHVEEALGEPERARAAFLEGLRLHSGARAEDDDATEDPPPGWSGWYNHACLLSKAGRTQRALMALARGVEVGAIGPGRSVDRAFLERDRDLDPLRDQPGYAELIALLVALETEAPEPAEPSRLRP